MTSSETPIPTPAQRSSALPDADSFPEVIQALELVFKVHTLAARVLGETEPGEVTTAVCLAVVPERMDVSVLHFVVLPQNETWIDLALEADRRSATMPYERFSEASDEDLVDVLRETMNLIHGVLKSAFRAKGIKGSSRLCSNRFPVTPSPMSLADHVSATAMCWRLEASGCGSPSSRGLLR